MIRRFISLPLLLLTAVVAHAQNKVWTVQDSVFLRRSLNGGEELKLNPEAVKKIDFGGLVGSPVLSTEKIWMLPDESLPQNLPDELEKKKSQLTLFPYTASTKFNWDPIYRKKIKVKKDTWRNDPLNHLLIQYVYSNWAKKPMDGGVRKSLEEIEATGLRYNPFGERANNMAVGRWEQVGGGTVSTPVTGGISIQGDFMAPFTKVFWDIKGRKRRARTLEVLNAYGDSISVMISHPLPKVLP